MRSVVTVIDLSPLLKTISAITNNRILPYFDLVNSADLHVAQIPVSAHHPTERKDTTMRQYMTDWIRKKDKRLAAKSSFQDFGSPSSYESEDGEFHECIGMIELTWWERPEEPEHKYRRTEVQGRPENDL